MAWFYTTIFAFVAQLAFAAIFLVTDGDVRTLALGGVMLCYGTIVGIAVGSSVRRRANRRADKEVSR